MWISVEQVFNKDRNMIKQNKKRKSTWKFNAWLDSISLHAVEKEKIRAHKTFLKFGMNIVNEMCAGASLDLYSANSFILVAGQRERGNLVQKYVNTLCQKIVKYDSSKDTILACGIF